MKQIDIKNKIVYVCSPFAGDIAANKEYARENTKRIIRSGGYPITPHLYITEVLNDNIEAERQQGLQVGLKLLDICDILCVFTEKGISQGMQLEIDYAISKGLEIRKM